MMDNANAHQADNSALHWVLNAAKTLPDEGLDALVLRTQGPIDFGELCALGMRTQTHKSSGPESLLDLLARKLMHEGDESRDGEVQAASEV